MIKACTEFVKKVSDKLAALLGTGKTLQINFGYRNEDLSLTEKGKELLLEMLADDADYDAALTAAATADKAEYDSRKKDCK